MWITLILLIIAGIALVATPILRSEDRPAFLLVTGVAGVLALVFGIFASITTVGTRQIGIETTFGRPNGSTLSNGLHFKAPWATVTEMDGAIQIDQHKGDNRIKVRLGNSSTADADVSVRWQIKQDATPELFVQYKTFDNVRTNLVTRNLQVALNEVFATFDPLAPKNLDKSPLPELSEQARKILASKVGTQVEILDVAVPTIDYDEGTEQKINQINQSRAATSVALQDQKTAEAQARANEILSSSVSRDPNVLVSKCLDIAKDRGIALLCWPTPVMPTVPTK
ncbi:SPFH domain-containing protein [Mycobacteroides chelonae]|uniref:SPFH domain-containing protein n=1 Tax=Mycobacteroides chelonae TaxID=1774 RepID=UPI000D68C4EF